MENGGESGGVDGWQAAREERGGGAAGGPRLNSRAWLWQRAGRSVRNEDIRGGSQCEMCLEGDGGSREARLRWFQRGQEVRRRNQ